MALLRCSCRRGMYVRRCEGYVGTFRLVFFLWKIVGAGDFLDALIPGGSDGSVAVNLFGPAGAVDGVAMDF